MATISKSGINPNQLIKSEHLTRIIDAFNGTSNVDIIITGPITGSEFTGSFIGDGSRLTGLPTGSASGSNISIFNNDAGYITSSIGGSGSINNFINYEYYDKTGDGLIGAQNSVNTDFTASQGAYDAGKIIGYINGLGYWSGSGLNEINPTLGYISFDVAPEVSDNILLVYSSGSFSETSGSVDLSNYVTLDGTETITGIKTFTANNIFSGAVQIFNSITRFNGLMQLDIVGGTLTYGNGGSFYYKGGSIYRFSQDGGGTNRGALLDFSGITGTSGTEVTYIYPDGGGTLSVSGSNISQFANDAGYTTGSGGLEQITGSLTPGASSPGSTFAGVISSQYDYVKIGSTVNYVLEIDPSGSFTTGESGSIVISGLPYTPKTGLTTIPASAYWVGGNHPTDESLVGIVLSSGGMQITYANQSGIIKTPGNIYIAGSFITD